jgi:hypothetical protein
MKMCHSNNYDTIVLLGINQAIGKSAELAPTQLNPDNLPRCRKLRYLFDRCGHFQQEFDSEASGL